MKLSHELFGACIVLFAVMLVVAWRRGQLSPPLKIGYLAVLALFVIAWVANSFGW